MSLKEVQEGKEYIIRQINTNDEELNSFLFSLECSILYYIPLRITHYSQSYIFTINFLLI